MNVHEGQAKFIETWGELSYAWGVSKTMAQLHALLLISDQALNAQDIQEKLEISIGSINKNIHNLLDWNLIYKINRSDSRKDYYEAEKNMSKVFICILKERKKRELSPLIKVLDDLISVDANCKTSTEFCKVVRDIKKIANTADSILDNVCSEENSWLVDSWMKL